jgi:RNA polymerase subunit RPABC4/transcription elongation factor Spt4
VCSDCGEIQKSEWKICPYCGKEKKLESAQSPSNTNSFI